MIRRLGPRDRSELLALQRQVLPDTMSARLGCRFNDVYHETMLKSDDYLCDGYFVDGQLVGYLSYTANTMHLLRHVLRRNILSYLGALVMDAVREPRTLGLILRVARSVLVPSREPSPGVTAELLSVGVLPEFRGSRGKDATARPIADDLLNNAIATLRARGVTAVRLVSKPVHVDPIPHRFVRKNAFTSVGAVRRFGLDGEMYVLNFAAAAQVGERHA
jgi:ribosomal protein S18 acetylase RimI-like enzyme